MQIAAQPGCRQRGRPARWGDDRGHRRTSGIGATVERGARPALLVVDLSRGFTEPQFATGATSQTRSRRRAACSRPLAGGRRCCSPRSRTSRATRTVSPGCARRRAGRARRRLRARRDRPAHRAGGRRAVLVKKGASAFFGTDLAERLHALGVDTLVVCGATTSGCVRACVVDAVQNDFPTLVVREAVGDRAREPHDANLFDIAPREDPGDVISVADAAAYLSVHDRARRAAWRTEDGSRCFQPLLRRAVPRSARDVRDEGGRDRCSPRTGRCRAPTTRAGSWTPRRRWARSRARRLTLPEVSTTLDGSHGAWTPPMAGTPAGGQPPRHRRAQAGRPGRRPHVPAVLEGAARDPGGRHPHPALHRADRAPDASSSRPPSCASASRTARSCSARRPSLRFTNARDRLTYQLGAYPVITQYGYTDTPGPLGPLALGLPVHRRRGRRRRRQGRDRPRRHHLPVQELRADADRAHDRARPHRRHPRRLDADLLSDYMAVLRRPEGLRDRPHRLGAEREGALVRPRHRPARDGHARPLVLRQRAVLHRPQPRARRHATTPQCHVDIPMRNCSLYLDDEPIVVDGDIVVPEMQAARRSGHEEAATSRTPFPSPFAVDAPPGAEDWGRALPVLLPLQRARAASSRRASSGSSRGCTTPSRSTPSTRS